MPMRDRPQVDAAGERRERLAIIPGEPLVEACQIGRRWSKRPPDPCCRSPTSLNSACRLWFGLRSSGWIVSIERRVGHADGVDDDEAILLLGVVGDRLEVRVVDDPHAAADHLLEVACGS